MNNTDTIPAGLYGRLATEGELAGYENKVRAKLTNTVTRDDDAGTLEAHSRKGTLMFRAIRKGAPGQPWILMLNPAFYPKPQVFPEGCVTVRRHPETREQYAVDYETNRSVPLEICRMAAGPDRWLRNVVFACVECKRDVRAGDTECAGLCPACYENAENENAEANA